MNGSIIVAGLTAAIIAKPYAVSAEELLGDKFRTVIAEINARCKREGRGPYLDTNDREYHSKAADTSCDILKLRPRDWRHTKLVKIDSQPYPIPEEWLATPEGRFAHSIKLPTAYDGSKSLYKPGMKREEYFRLLCKEEAGDFVIRPIANVDGIARHRLPEVATDDLLRHLFASEGTGAMGIWQMTSNWDDIADVLIQPRHGRYSFVETPAFPRSIKADGFRFRRFDRDPVNASGTAINYRPDGSTYTVPNEIVDKGLDRLSARFAFTWRGITRPNDREMGIAGAELIILDLQTNDVLAFRRIFRATTVSKLGVWWLSAASCSAELATLPTEFIYRVLQPVH
jgi:hypothetical protein